MRFDWLRSFRLSTPPSPRPAPRPRAAWRFLQLEPLESRVLLTAGPESAAFVAQVYQDLLYRGPDRTGLSYWQAVLD
jgi:hypothetical protein